MAESHYKPGRTGMTTHQPKINYSVCAVTLRLSNVLACFLCKLRGKDSIFGLVKTIERKDDEWFY